jgi:hypothetical protein
MNIELTPIEAAAIRNLLEADMIKMGFNLEHCNLLSGIKKKTYCTPTDNLNEDDYFFPGEFEYHTRSQRWGK